ncbi:hypothetical protein QJS04_geneDACA000158 [Acorus gramineus]|uniref:RING-type domain-containing protein n=1 Tax=Acorus gramineus TaxID=55184 RepID=A0AAV9ARE0_ACOGR|nr:hypothetical protein QJS04_geneDACA000158 [Acorus gramineus]
MEGIDADEVMEVPDTPDRLTRRGVNAVDQGEERGTTDEFDDGLSFFDRRHHRGQGSHHRRWGMDIDNWRRPYHHRRHRHPVRNDKSDGSSSVRNDDRFGRMELTGIFRKNPEREMPKETREVEPGPGLNVGSSHGRSSSGVGSQCNQKGKMINFGWNPSSIRSFRKTHEEVTQSSMPSNLNEGIDLCDDSHHETDDDLLRSLVRSPDYASMRSNTFESDQPNSTNSSNLTHVGVNRESGVPDKQKRIDVRESALPISLPRKEGHRRLVRNGCIAPRNIARASQIASQRKIDDIGTPSSGVATSEIHIISPDSGGSGVGRTMGKGVVDGATLPNDLGTSTRSLLISSESGSDNESHEEARGLVRGKRKCSSTSNNLGECSSSTFDRAEISHFRTTRRPSYRGSSRNRDSERQRQAMDSIIDIDDFSSPELRHANLQHQVISDDSEVRARQLESDEMLARELQEQFYREAPVMGTVEEIDANLAWTLQQEEDALRLGSSHSREAPVRRYSYQPVFQHSSFRSANRTRVPTSARMTQLMRSFRDRSPTVPSNEMEIHLPSNMDFETRLHLLEALEVAYNNNNTRTSSRLPQVQRDFNENDYEMLLSLDNDNHQHGGASLNQINSLPQSVVQTNNFEEACAICLDTPSLGDTIRHLPCLHKFHKDCIDPWLRRKTACPICKSDIT